MPVLHLHLLSLHPSTTATQIVTLLKADPETITRLFLASVPHHWVIRPSHHDSDLLTSTKWHLLLLAQHTDPAETMFSPAVTGKIITRYTLSVGVPARLLANYPSHNATLLRTAPSVPLTGSLDDPPTPQRSDSQHLELDSSLREFMTSFSASRGDKQPVTMLNLLCFNPGMKASYANYGETFRSTGGRRGGDAKIVGNVIKGGRITGEGEWWNEIALVHYPSIRHFCDMAAGEDYQAGNREFRLPALYDTILLCTTEVDLGGVEGAKL